MSRLVALALAAVAALVLAACGGDDAPSADVDPATAVPAGSLLYAEIAIRPEGKLGNDARAALAKLLRTRDPIARIEKLLDDASSDDEPGELGVDDLRRWAGSRVGVFAVVNRAADDVDAGIVMPVTDADRARADLERTGKGDREGRYRDTRYWIDDDGFAAGVSGDWLVAGDEAQLRRAVDTIDGGDSLAGDALETTREAVDADDSLAFVSVDTKAIIELLRRTPQARAQLPDELTRKALDEVGDGVGLSLVADRDSIVANAALIGADLPASGDRTSSSLGDLPSGGWLAARLGKIDLTKGLRGSQFQQLPPEARRQIDDALAQIQRETGVDVERDLLSWMGETSVVAGGQELTELGVAISIASRRPGAPVDAVNQIAKLIRSFDRDGAVVLSRPSIDGYDTTLRLRVADSGNEIPAVYLAARDDRLAIGNSPRQLAELVRPATRLADTPLYRTARSLLGDDVEPAMILDLPAIVRLIENSSADVARDESYRAAKPYLDVFGVIAAGGGRDGDVERGSVAVELR